MPGGMGCIFIAWLFVMTLILAPILAVLGYAPWWIGHADSTREWLGLGVYFTALGAATLGCVRYAWRQMKRRTTEQD